MAICLHCCKHTHLQRTTRSLIYFELFNEIYHIYFFQNKHDDHLMKRKKEVIQPQVPLRLPCDDLTHLTELRFDAIKESQLTWTLLGWFDGRCVQGAGTYSPDDDYVWLLGIPTSWGWVATLNLNLDRVLRLGFTFQCCIQLSLPLLRACSPENSEHTDLPLPAPSSLFPRQSLQCSQSYRNTR